MMKVLDMWYEVNENWYFIIGGLDEESEISPDDLPYLWNKIQNLDNEDLKTYLYNGIFYLSWHGLLNFQGFKECDTEYRQIQFDCQNGDTYIYDGNEVTVIPAEADR